MNEEGRMKGEIEKRQIRMLIGNSERDPLPISAIYLQAGRRKHTELFPGVCFQQS